MLGDVVPTCCKCTFWASHRVEYPKKFQLKQSDPSVGRDHKCETLWRRRPQRAIVDPPSSISPSSIAEPSIPERPKKKRKNAMHTAKQAQITAEEAALAAESKEIALRAQLDLVQKELADVKKELALAREEIADKEKSVEKITKDLEAARLQHKKELDATTSAIYTNERQWTKTNAAIVTNPSVSEVRALEAFLRIRYRNQHGPTKATKLLDAISSPQFADGAGRDVLFERAAEIGKQVLCPLKDPELVAKAMDLNGGFAINHRGLNVLRSIGREYDNPHASGWLASNRQVQAVVLQVETSAAAKFPIHKVDLAGIDGVSFEYEPLLHYLLELYCLKEIAVNQGGVNLSMTLDAADLSRNLTHITAGIKITDPRAIDPMTGLPFGMTKREATVQSRDVCIPFKIVLHPDKSGAYDDFFGDFFEFFKLLQAPDGAFGYKAFNITSPQDGSSVWKTMKRGGACKVARFFCPYCVCTSDDILRPNQVRCQRCVVNGRNQCFHWPVADEDTLLRITEELSALEAEGGPYVGMFAKFDELTSTLKLHYKPHYLNKTSIKDNIEYEPKTTEDFSSWISERVAPDLIALGLPTNGSPEVMRARLQDALQHIELRRHQREKHAHCEYPDALAAIDQCIPCILHLENRCGEKIVKMLMIEAFARFETDTAAMAFVREMEELVNTQILGNPSCPTNWRAVIGNAKEGGRIVGDQTMPNRQVRKFIDGFDLLADLCLDDNPRHVSWKQCIAKYRQLIIKLRNKEDFSDALIESFQLTADEFFASWMELHGRDGVTNYIHMIGSGHLHYFLERNRNLHRFSQQGWESMNALIKSFFFRRTQRGGYAGVKDQPTSRVWPLGRFFQRRLWWLSGEKIMREAKNQD